MVTLNTASTIRAFQKFKQNIQNSIRFGERIDYRKFYASIKDFGDKFELQGQHHVMNCTVANFADILASKKQYSLASIIYGILIKRNENNPFLLEHFGHKALNVAKNLNDPIHIMARADNLNQLYRTTAYGSKKHILALVEEEKALQTIVSNYDTAIKSYKTISREALPFERYEFMLCGIKMEIAKLEINSNPQLAIAKLTEAQNIMQKHGYGTISQRIESLLKKANSKL